MSGASTPLRAEVRGGVVVLPEGAALPEGAEVLVTAMPSPHSAVPDQAACGGSIWSALAQLGRAVEADPSDLPDDLARNHDHYLHGRPKLP